MSCLADCFLDDKEIRPIASPFKLVWLYFGVDGFPEGTLELRQFNSCVCGCDKLIANPPANKSNGPKE